MQKVIRAKTKQELLSYDFLMALADRINRLGLSREKTMTWLYVTLTSWEGLFEDGEGNPVHIHDKLFDLAYGKDSEDWHSNVKRFVSNPPKRRPKASLLKRFMLWDLAFGSIDDPIVLPTY